MKKIMLIILMLIVCCSVVFGAWEDDVYGYFPMDGNSSDYFNNLTSSDTGVTYTTDDSKLGTHSANFSTTNTDRIEINGSSELLDFDSHDFTISVWAKSSSNKTWSCMLTNAWSGDAGWQFCAKDENPYSLLHIGGSYPNEQGTGDIMNNTWNHLLWRRDNTRGVSEFWVNGVLNTNETGYTGNIADSAGTVTAIGYYKAGLDVDWEGLIDEVIIWGRFVNLTEISTLASGTNPFGSGADTTSPTITQATYNLTSAKTGENKTAWRSDTNNSIETFDSTPSLKFSTSEDAWCAISTTDGNFSTINNSNSQCQTGFASDHTCTLPSTDPLTLGNQFLYVGCIDATGNEGALSTSGGLNITKLSQNVSLQHVDIDIDAITFDSATYILVGNDTFNVSNPTAVTFKGQLQSQGKSGGDNVISVKVLYNNETVFDKVVRTISGTKSWGVSNIPIVEKSTGTNPQTVLIYMKEVGVGAVTISSFEIHLDSERTNDEVNITDLHDSFDGTYSSVSFVNLANFTLDKLFNSTTMVMLEHRFSKTGAGDVNTQCYLENMNTSEITTTYRSYLASATSVKSSGVSYRSNIKSVGAEVWKLMCSASNTDTVVNNVTTYIWSDVDQNGNTIQGLGNVTDGTSITASTGITKILSHSGHVVANGTQLEMVAGIYFESTTGKQEDTSTPLVIFNSSALSEDDCFESYNRSLIDNDDQASVLFHINCDNITVGNVYPFDLYMKVASGESVTVTNATIVGYEVVGITISESNTAPLPNTITNPTAGDYFVNDSVLTITWNAFTDLDGDSVWYNVTLLNSTGDYVSTLNTNTSSLSHGASITDIGVYQIQVEGCDSSGACSTFISGNFTITDPVTITLLTPTNTTKFSGWRDSTILTFEFTNSTATSYNCTLYGGRGNNTPTTVLNTSWVCNPGTNSVRWDPLNENWNAWRIQITDNFGIVSNSSKFVFFNLLDSVPTTGGGGITVFSSDDDNIVEDQPDVTPVIVEEETRLDKIINYIEDQTPRTRFLLLSGIVLIGILIVLSILYLIITLAKRVGGN